MNLEGLWWSVGFVLAPALWDGLDAKSSRLWTIIGCMSCRTPCRFVYSFKLPWSLRPSSSSLKWSGTDKRSQHIPPMSDLEFNGHGRQTLVSSAPFMLHSFLIQKGAYPLNPKMVLWWYSWTAPNSEAQMSDCWQKQWKSNLLTPIVGLLGVQNRWTDMRRHAWYGNGNERCVRSATRRKL